MTAPRAGFAPIYGRLASISAMLESPLIIESRRLICAATALPSFSRVFFQFSKGLLANSLRIRSSVSFPHWTRSWPKYSARSARIAL